MNVTIFSFFFNAESLTMQDESLERIKIVELSSRGFGVGFLADRRLSIPFALPGEEILIERGFTSTNKETFMLRRILTPSSERCDPRCSQAPICPGCQLRHLEYASQLRRLRERTIEQFARICPGMDVQIEETVGAPKSDGYRRRCRLKVLVTEDGIRLGMKSRRAPEEFVPLSDCTNHDPLLNEFIQRCERILGSGGFEVIAASIDCIVIELNASGKTRTTVCTSNREIAGRLKSEIRSNAAIDAFSWHVLHLAEGLDHIDAAFSEPVGEMDEFTFAMHYGDRNLLLTSIPGVWTPVSNGTSELLAKKISAIVGQENQIKTILEIGCGMGCQSFPLWMEGYRVTGIDSRRCAILSAAETARNLGLANTEFLNGDGAHFIKKFASRQRCFDAVIFHGMRKPFGEETFRMLRLLQAKKIILISPSIQALANDLHHFPVESWHFSPISLFNQIPHTASALGLISLTPRQPGVR